MTPLTRQIGRAMLPTGDGFEPAGSDSTNVMVVSGKFRAAMSRGCRARSWLRPASERVRPSRSWRSREQGDRSDDS